MGTVRQEDGRHLRRRVGLHLQHRAACAKEAARAQMLGRSDQARLQGRGADLQPLLLRHRLHRARDVDPALGRGQGVRLAQEAARQRQPVHPLRPRPRAQRRARRDDHRHHLPARRGLRGCRRGTPQGRSPLRRHGLRDRLDVDHQGRPQSRQRQEMVRLVAERRGAEPRQAGEILPGAVQPRRLRAAPGAAPRGHEAHRLRLHEIRHQHRAQAHRRPLGKEVGSLPR